MTTYTTYDQVGKKEDVSDIITDISPLATPMFTLMKKEKIGRAHVWTPSHSDLVCRLLLEKKNSTPITH